MSEHDLMKLLYQLGFRRAAILDRDVLNGSLRRMFFKIQTIQLSQKSLRIKEPSPWPLNQPAHNIFSLSRATRGGPASRFCGPFQFSTHILLCQEFEGYDFPSVTREALLQCDQSLAFEGLDRLFDIL